MDNISKFYKVSIQFRLIKLIIARYLRYEHGGLEIFSIYLDFNFEPICSCNDFFVIFFVSKVSRVGIKLFQSWHGPLAPIGVGRPIGPNMQLFPRGQIEIIYSCTNTY